MWLFLFDKLKLNWMISSCLGSCTAAWLEGKIEVQFLVSVFIQRTVPLTVSLLCYNSTLIEADQIFNFSCTFDVGVMVDFVCNVTAKSHSCRYFVDFSAKAEYVWSQNATSGSGGCWKLAVGSVSHRWTGTLWTNWCWKILKQLCVNQGMKLSFSSALACLRETATSKKKTGTD